MYSAKKRDVEHIRVTLTSKLSFDTTVELDDKGELKKLTIKAIENKNYVENFFSKDDRVDVTGIIGKNGIGKSAILDEIYDGFNIIQKVDKNLKIDNNNFKLFIVEEYTDETVYKVYVHSHSCEITVNILDYDCEMIYLEDEDDLTIDVNESKITKILYNNDVINDSYNYNFYGDIKNTLKIILNDSILNKCTKEIIDWEICKEIIDWEIYKEIIDDSYIYKFIDSNYIYMPENRLINRYRHLTYDILDNLFILDARINLVSGEDKVNSINFKSFLSDAKEMAISTFTLEEIEDELVEPYFYMDMEDATDRDYMFLIYFTSVDETKILNIHEKYINIINMMIVDCFLLLPEKLEKEDISEFISKFVLELVEIIKNKNLKACIEELNCLQSKILIYATKKIEYDIDDIRGCFRNNSS